MEILQQLQAITQKAIQEAYGKEIEADKIVINPTRSDMKGDFTVVTFALAKILGERPDMIATKIGDSLNNDSQFVDETEVVKGFLNISLSSDFWKQQLLNNITKENFGYAEKTGVKTVIEFSSPNTNKPLHLGHVRNILLGWSLSKILEAAGEEVKRVQIINDRGIAICKSMVAWQKFANGETPQTNGRKGDMIVGHYYVQFEKEFAAEYEAWQTTDEGKAILAEVKTKADESAAKAYKNTYFNTQSALGKEAREMLLSWEAGDEKTRDLWKMMNGWVYQGHNATYDRLGVSFDKLYYESDTYLLGKDMAKSGLESEAFYKKDDGSIWADLTPYKLDQKIVLRANGTSVYITQDLGTAHLRFKDFEMDRMIYVTGDEQNYHFQALFAALKLIKEPYAEQLNHLGYGMIDLTTGKMKTREGTVVDADDLMQKVVNEALANAEERAEFSNTSKEEREKSAEQVGLAALKYYILRVGAKKRMVFNPKESVELQGTTGPYIQYSFVRANGVSAKAQQDGFDAKLIDQYTSIASAERELIKQMVTYPDVIKAAANSLDPAEIANYAYQLAKGYHRFWHDHSILSAESDAAKAFRVKLSQAVANNLSSAMDLLGISMPDKM